MGSGVSRVYRGSFVGTGAAKEVECTFQPRSVKVFNGSTAGSLEWFDPMPEASAIKTVTGGAQTFITTNGITAKQHSFIIGADAVNSAGGICYFEATE